MRATIEEKKKRNEHDDEQLNKQDIKIIREETVMIVNK